MEQVNIQTRLTYIDIAKAFAILLVVAGHVAQYCLIGTSSKNVFNFIYSFHMPLFFFLSGYVASLSRDRIDKKRAWPFFLNKVRSLLLPFFVWGIIVYLLFQPSFSLEDSYTRIIQVLLIPSNSAPWFLLTLFCIQLFFLFFCLLSNLFGKNRWTEIVVAIITGALIAGGYLLTSNYYYFSIYYSITFFAGYFYKIIFDGEINDIVCFVLLILFCLFSPRFDLNESPSYMKMLLGVAASILVIKIVKRINWSPSVYGKLGSIGRHTLEIYVVQCFGLYMITKPMDVSDIHPIFLFVLLLFFSLLFSAVIIESSKLLSNIPFVGLLLFGKKQKN